MHLPPDWKDVETETPVYRFVKQPSKDAPRFVRNFWSDRKRKKPPMPGREEEHDELRDGMSAFITEDLARDAWEEQELLRNPPGRPREPLRMGDYIAKVVLMPGQGFLIDLEPDGHLTLRGDAQKLADAVAEPIYSAKRDLE
jgi:hypothetical protein